jgi:serine/threonine protein kinase/WD40 repeat protein
MSSRNSEDNIADRRSAHGTQLPGSFAAKPDSEPSRNEHSGDSVSVAGPAHGTFIAPPATAHSAPPPQRLVPPAADAVTRTYASGDREVVGILKHARTQQRSVSMPDPEGLGTGTRRSTGKPKSPTAGKSTWNLRIRERGVAGHISGIINEIPADPSQATGLLSALAVNESLPEYEVLGELGQGSMGVVYRARQTSLNRDLAIKTLKPGLSNPEYDQAMFVSEAVVTAHLVHPNIVPIHDLGRTADGKLFYSMKQVSGTPWHHTIKEMTLEQNLDIFLKVCDGVAFAHSRGVINRDLKPENVIIGDYGEVVVLDWGLALTTDGFARRDSVMLDFRGGGGTPIYMAPELAEDDVSNVGVHTDVYLLGAILFEILEGRGPHWLRRIEQMADPAEQLNGVLWAVLQNEIETQVNNEGELMEIARKAMSTHPMDRYASVAELQEAIREYRVTGRAEELMQKVESKKTIGYSEYQTAVALYDEALRKWPSNRRALEGDRKARKAYAELALKKGDVDLGLQVLPERTDRDFEPVRKKLKRTRRNRAIMRGTWGLATVGAAVAALVALQMYSKVVDKAGTIEQMEAEEVRLTATREQAEADATAARIEADREKIAAAGAKKEAIAALVEAEREKTAAVAAKKEAVTALRDADREKLAAAAAKREAAAARSEAEKEKSLAAAAKIQVAESKALIESARKDVQAAQAGAFSAFEDQIKAKKEIDKFDEAADLIDAELNKETVNPILLRQEELFRGIMNDLRIRHQNEAIDIGKQLGSRSLLSGDGSTLVAESRDLLTVFRDVQMSSPRTDFGHEIKLSESVRQLIVSKSGNVICVVGRKAIQTWKWSGESYRPITLPRNANSITSVSKCLVSSADDHIYLVGDGGNGELLVEVHSVSQLSATFVARGDLCEFLNSKIVVNDAVLLPDETGLLLLTPEQNLRLVRMSWQGSQCQLVLHKIGVDAMEAYPLLPVDEAAGKKFAPLALEISADGKHIAVLTKTAEILILTRADSAAAGTIPYDEDQIKVVKCHYAPPIATVRFSADNSRLLVAQSRYLQVWDKAADAWKISDIDGLYAGHSLAAHSDDVLAAGFMKDSNNRLLSVSKKIVRLWNTETYGEYAAAARRQKLAALLQLDDRVTPATKVARGMSPINHDVLVTRIARPKYHLTAAQVAIDTPVASKARRFQQGRKVYSAEFSSDSQRVIIGANDLAAHAFHTQTGEQTLTLSMTSPRDPFFAPEKNNFVEGHIPEIVSLMFLPPQGELLLTFDYFGSLSVWDAKDDADGIGFEKSRLLPNSPVDMQKAGEPYEVEDPSCEVAASPDGKWLIAGIVRNDGAASLENSKDEYFAAIWNTENIKKTGQVIPDKELKGVFKNQITAAAISPDSKTAVTATRRGAFVLWDIESTKVLAQADGAHNSDGVSGVFFVSDTEFVSSGFDGAVLRWKIADGELTKEAIERPKGQVEPDFIIRLRPSPDGTRFITADLNRERKSKDYRLTLSHWSQSDGWQSLPLSISAPQSDLGSAYRHDISWSEDGQEILFVHDGKLVVLDAASLKPTEGFQLPPDNDAVRGAIAPKGPGGMCVATFDGRRAQMWNLSNGEHIADFRSHGPVVRAGFSVDRKYVITASDSIRVFNADENSSDHGLPVFRLPRKIAGPRLIEQAEFSSLDKDYRFASIDTAGTVRLWEWNPDGSPPMAAGFDSGPAARDGVDWMDDEKVTAANRVAWSPEAKQLAAIQHGQLRLWNVTGAGLQEVQVTLPPDVVAQNLAFNDLDFSEDGTQLVVAGVIWTQDEDLKSWAVVLQLIANQAVPVAVLDAEGDQRHSAAYRGPANDRKPELRGITAVVFNDRDAGDETIQTIVTGGADSNVLPWLVPESIAGEIVNPRPLTYRKGRRTVDSFDKPHEASISALGMASDGSMVSADESGWIVIWPSGR